MNHYKKSFTLLELIFTISIIFIIVASIRFDFVSSSLSDAKNRIELYLNYTRYIAFLDNKYDPNDDDWKKRLWTLKFQKCSSSIGGLYFVVYSDKDTSTSHFKKEDCLKDPLTNKYLYSNWDCNPSGDESKYILLTKQYGVTKVNISCNTTSTIGQISFGNDGKVYSSLGSTPSEIKEKCYITLYDKDDNNISLTIEPNSGYINGSNIK